MKKILLVSSSDAFLERNLNLLKRTDCQILTANTGEAAVRLHQQEQVNLLISELNLDDMGGDELCTLIHKEDSLRNVVFIVTCRENSDELERAEKSGAHVRITKPIQPLQLLTIVEQFLSVQMVRSKRVHLRVNVLILRENRSFSCVSHDISNTGILLETNEHLDWGDQIKCQFTLPKSNHIEVDGEVVRSVPSLDGDRKYGVRFIGVQQEILIAIEEYVAGFNNSIG